MPTDILAIVPSDFALGFKLTGIDTIGCASSIQAKEYLEKELAEKRYQLIIVDEEYLGPFDSRFNKRIEESVLPLITAVPLKKEFTKQAEEKDYFLKMVQSAIGYEIRIK